MIVKFKKLLPIAKLPKKQTDSSAGYDLYTPCIIKVKPGRQIIPLHFAIQLPEGYCANIDPRSGFSAKGMEGYFEGKAFEDGVAEPQRFDCDVVHGLIDSDYRGCCGVIINNRSGFSFLLPTNTRIAQMVITKHESVEFVEVEDLDKTERGDGGFGHTGTN